MSELVTINAADYGLEENKAKQISDMFKPMLDKMTDLEVQFNEVIKRPIEPETMQMAKDLRLAYRDVRMGTFNIHKDLKAFYLQGGRFVDGWKNAQLMASEGNEARLKEIEDHFKNQEIERIKKLQAKRESELQKYELEEIPINLGIMEVDVWDNYLAGKKMNYDAQKEAERKAEEDRIEKEKADIAERERIRKENEQLRKEAEERERREEIEKEQREKEQVERLRKEREEREANEAAIKKEREGRERVEAELNAKAEVERKAREDEQLRIQSELNKGDSDKVNDLISDLNQLKLKYTFKSKKNQQMYSDVSVLIDKVIKHIEQ